MDTIQLLRRLAQMRQLAPAPVPAMYGAATPYGQTMPDEAFLDAGMPSPIQASPLRRSPLVQAPPRPSPAPAVAPRQPLAQVPMPALPNALGIEARMPDEAFRPPVSAPRPQYAVPESGTPTGPAGMDPLRRLMAMLPGVRTYDGTGPRPITAPPMPPPDATPQMREDTMRYGRVPPPTGPDFDGAPTGGGVPPSPVATSPIATGAPDLEGQRGVVRPSALPPALQALVGPPPPKPAPPPRSPSLGQPQGNPGAPVGSPGPMPAEIEAPAPSPAAAPQIADDLSAFPGVPRADAMAANGGNGADDGMLAGLMKKFPNLPQSLLSMGLATMAAGGKPGATFGGAIGEGGLAAMQLHEQRRRNDLKDKMEERQLTQGDRRLDLEQKGLDIKAKDFLLQLEQRATDNKLNREQRAEAQREMLEFRKLTLEAQQGSAAAQRSLTAMIEGGRREDRQAEQGRRGEEGQRRLDEDAGRHYRERLEAAQKSGQDETPDLRRKIEGEILDIYGPRTRLGRTALYRQLGETIEQIKASPLAPEEKERRIGEARKRVDEAMK